MFDYLNKINSDHSIIFMLIRTFIIYIYAIFLIRVGNKRFSFKTNFDYIMIVIAASVLSRCINGSAYLTDTMLNAGFLFFLHWVFAQQAYYSHRFGQIIKGHPILIIQNGQLLFENLKQNQITIEDLKAVLRERLGLENLDAIETAYLERTGKISLILKPVT